MYHKEWCAEAQEIASNSNNLKLIITFILVLCYFCLCIIILLIFNNKFNANKS